MVFAEQASSNSLRREFGRNTDHTNILTTYTDYLHTMVTMSHPHPCHLLGSEPGTNIVQQFQIHYSPVESLCLVAKSAHVNAPTPMFDEFVGPDGVTTFGLVRRSEVTGEMLWN